MQKFIYSARIGSLFTGMVLFTLVILDVYLTLRNPFYPRERRIPSYLLVLIISMGIFLSNLIVKW